MLFCRHWLNDNHLIDAAYTDTRQGMDQQPDPHFNIGSKGDSQPMELDNSDPDEFDDDDSSYHEASDSDFDPNKTFESFVSSMFSDDDLDTPESSSSSDDDDPPDLHNLSSGAPLFTPQSKTSNTGRKQSASKQPASSSAKGKQQQPSSSGTNQRAPQPPNSGGKQSVPQQPPSSSSSSKGRQPQPSTPRTPCNDRNRSGLAFDDSFIVNEPHCVRIHNRMPNGSQANLCWMDGMYLTYLRNQK